MHAIVCHEHGGPDVMKYEEIAKPEPAAWEVLIKAEAIGVIFKDKDRIAVEFQRKQYELVSINDLATKKILDSARKQFGGLWKKRLAEDLVEVMAAAGSCSAPSHTYLQSEQRRTAQSELWTSWSTSRSCPPLPIFRPSPIMSFRQN